MSPHLQRVQAADGGGAHVVAQLGQQPGGGLGGAQGAQPRVGALCRQQVLAVEGQQRGFPAQAAGDSALSRQQRSHSPAAKPRQGATSALHN